MKLFKFQELKPFFGEKRKVTGEQKRIKSEFDSDNCLLRVNERMGKDHPPKKSQGYFVFPLIALNEVKSYLYIYRNIFSQIYFY